MNKRCSSYRQKRHENKKKETKDEIRLFKVTFCGGSSWSSTSLNWEIPRLESTLSRCLWRCFLRMRTKDPAWVRPHHLMGWGPGDNKAEKERTSCQWILPFTFSSSPLPPITSLFPVCYEVGNSAPPYGFLTSNMAVVVSISTAWKPWSLRNHEPKQIFLAWGARQKKKSPTNTFFLRLEDKVRKTEQQEK